MLKQLRVNENNIIIWIIFILSILNIIQYIYFKPLSPASIGVSLIGLVSVLLYAFNKSTFKISVGIWIALQSVIYIRYCSIGNEPLDLIIDLSQLVSVKLGLSSGNNQDFTGIYFNGLVIIYIYLFWKSKANILIGKQVSLLFLKGNHDLRFEENTIALITKRITLNGDDNWILAQLNNPITYNSQIIDRIAIHTDKGSLESIFRIIPQSVDMTVQDKLLNFERVEWIAYA